MIAVLMPCFYAILVRALNALARARAKTVFGHLKLALQVLTLFQTKIFYYRHPQIDTLC